MIFSDRSEAGRRLGERLRRFKDRDPVVFALPRGGVPVGYEIARALHAPLDLILVRKIGAPYQEELAIGAVAEGTPPEIVKDQALIERIGVPDTYLTEATRTAVQEIARRRQAYLAGRPAVDAGGKTAIVVDDGIATGATMQAALRAIRRRKPKRLVLAVPVAPPDSLERLRKLVDEVVCLDTPDDFMAVGQFYVRFPQLQDAEVTALMDRAAAAQQAG